LVMLITFYIKSIEGRCKLSEHRNRCGAKFYMFFVVYVSLKNHNSVRILPKAVNIFVEVHFQTLFCQVLTMYAACKLGNDLVLKI
jgi:hypothetical protein